MVTRLISPLKRGDLVVPGDPGNSLFGRFATNFRWKVVVGSDGDLEIRAPTDLRLPVLDNVVACPWQSDSLVLVLYPMVLSPSTRGEMEPGWVGINLASGVLEWRRIRDLNLEKVVSLD